MSFEINLHPCLECGRIIPKRIYESRRRLENRRYCSLECGRAKMARDKVGWWSTSNTINPERVGKKTIDDIAPIIESESYFKQFDKDYGDLLSGLESE